MSKIVELPVKHMPTQAPEIDEFFKKALLAAKEGGRTRFVLVSVGDDSKESYDHTINCFGIKTSEALAMLLVAQDALLKSLKS